MREFPLIIIFSFLLSTQTSLACSWCVAKNEKVAKELIALSRLDGKPLIRKIEKQGVCIKVLDSKRPTPKQFFSWKDAVEPEKLLSSVSKIKNIMGKTLCQGEHKISEKCPTIVLASDAPKSTLLHEYLHIKQLKKDDEWCEISKALWGKKKISKETQRRMLNKEWDVLKLLWKNRDELKINIEDKVTIANELLEQAGKRSPFDPAAMTFIKEQNVKTYLTKVIKQYKKQLRNP